ncbi:CGNR zinc finger domain-containing protein [Haliangium sp.]|uniref:CGNR zinc finger domain-containing protein n=1 Tax=Haliangium sp. TaxID=2663208 RepID=UPI003D0CB1D9
MDWTFDLCGDHLALDFANTVSARHGDTPIERLPSYPELVSFARQTELINAARAKTLLARARRHQAKAEAVLAQARSLREALYRLFAAIARGQTPAAADVAALDHELPRLHLGVDLALTWRRDASALDDFLGAIVQAALALATDEDQRARVRICEAPDCVWLFHDSSRNRSRRWCDMRQCGNRMKARRHHARHR